MKNKTSPVYALIGDDSFLQSLKLREVIDRLPADLQRTDLDGELAAAADLFDELRSFAMFGGGKLVVVRNAETFIPRYREMLEAYLAAPADSATLVLRVTSLPASQRVYKLIQKLGGIEKCEPPKARDLPQWIIDRARSAHQAAIAADAARLLADLIGVDPGRIDNELEKLALQCNGGRIDAKIITGTVAFQRDQQMWDMTGELAGGKPAEALRRWRQLVRMDSSAEFRAVTWLAIWLENVRKALAMKKAGMNPFAIAKELRIWQKDQQQPFFRTADALGEAGVKRGVDLLAEIDLQSKTGVGTAAANVERFLLSIIPSTRSGRPSSEIRADAAARNR